MECPDCRTENPDTNVFCNYCGARLEAAREQAPSQPSEESEDRPAPEHVAPDETAPRAEQGDGGPGGPAGPEAGAGDTALAALEEQVRDLSSQVRSLRATFRYYGMQVVGDMRVRPRPEAEALRRPPFPPDVTVEPDGAAALATPPPYEPPLLPDRGPRLWERDINWEMLLGGNWLARIGILAVVIGMGFFLKLAFDNNWIGETGRVVLGIIAGLALLGAGEYWQRRYPVYAQALVGGGIAVLYLAIFAAFAMYDLIGIYPAVGILLLISIASAVQAIRHESTALAVIGVAGAFSAPFILGGFGGGRGLRGDGGGAAKCWQLLGYILAVDVGVLVLSTFRNWRWFTLLALVGSLAGFGAWYAAFMPGHYELVGDGRFAQREWVDGALIAAYGHAGARLVAQTGLTLIFLTFVGATTMFHMVWRRAPKSFDQTLMIVNATAFFGISYGLLWDHFRPWMGAFTLLLALFYGVVAYVALRRSRENAYLSLMALGIALICLTIAIPVQLGAPWVSIAWAVEGAVLMWLSFRMHMPQLRIASVVVFAAFAVWLVGIDTPAAVRASLAPIFNRYLPAYMVAMAATAAAAYFLRRNREELHRYETGLFPVFLIAANVFLTLAVPVQVHGAWTAVAWAVEAVVLIWFSYRLNLREMRLFGIGVLAVLVVRLAAFDTVIPGSGYRIFLNTRMLAFVPSIAAAYLSAYLVWRYRDGETDRETRYLVPALIVGANLLTLWALSAEVIGAIDSRAIKVSYATAGNVKSLSLSVLWAVYASVALALGIAKTWRPVRLGALALLAIPIIKLFLFDSFALERGFRVAAFLSLGGILLTGGFLYQRYSQAIRGFLFEEQTPAPES